jgi:hypothetical protein
VLSSKRTSNLDPAGHAHLPARYLLLQLDASRRDALIGRGITECRARGHRAPTTFRYSQGGALRVAGLSVKVHFFTPMLPDNSGCTVPLG